MKVIGNEEDDSNGNKKCSNNGIGNGGGYKIAFRLTRLTSQLDNYKNDANLIHAGLTSNCMVGPARIFKID